jgi:hypothetical protein
MGAVHKRERGNATLKLLACIASAIGVHCVTLDDASTQRPWLQAEEVHATASGTGVEVGVDADGNAVAVWSQQAPSADDVWSSRYVRADEAWAPGEKINLKSGVERDSVSVSVNAAGSALATWVRGFGAEDIVLGIWAASDGVWSRPAGRINHGGADGAMPPDAVPRLSMNADGVAMAVWIEIDAARESVWANRFAPASGWQEEPSLVEDSDAALASSPAVAVDPGGNAIAVWSMADTATFNIWSARYTVGNGWGEAAVIENNDSGDAEVPQIGVDAQGNAVAVWRQTNGARYDIWSNRYTQGDWGGAVRIEPDDDESDADAPQVAVSPSGTAVAVWSLSDGEREEVWANDYAPSRDWGRAQRIDGGDSSQETAPQVAADREGRAVAVWRQARGGSDEIWANQYAVHAGWGEAIPISPRDQTELGSPSVAMNANGSTFALWTAAGDGVWASRLE